MPDFRLFIAAKMIFLHCSALKKNHLAKMANGSVSAVSTSDFQTGVQFHF